MHIDTFSIFVMIDVKYIEQIRDIALREESPEKIILFGSVARGDNDADSDVDILIIKQTSEPLPRRTRRLRQLLSSFPFSKDILVLTPEEFERWKDIPQSFNATVQREGRILYEKKDILGIK